GSTLVTRTTGTAPLGAAGARAILRYFDIAATTNTGLDAALTIEYFTHELNGITPANLRFFKSIDNGANWQNKGISSTGPNYAVLTSLNGFSRWTLADLTAPLPVGLTAFRAERQGRNALLSWETASEQDNRGFGLEVSLDGRTYQQIGYVAAEGVNSSSARRYSYLDTTPGKAGARYYRLRQDDRSGTAHYFAPQRLSFEAEGLVLAAYPTQFSSELTVALTAPDATTATFRLLDMMGREVWRQEQALAPGAAPLRVQPACT
ncbi:hypothetical protein, partial [Hymenobacter agri]